MGTPKDTAMESGIPLRAIIDELINCYGLDESEEARNNLRRAILRVCKKICVKDTALIEMVKKGHGKERPRYIFTAEQKELLIHSEELLNYISASYPGTDISKNIELERRIDRFKEAEIAGLASEIDGPSDHAPQGVTEQEVQRKKLSMMVEALFSIFFTGFDVEALRRDMNMSADYQTPFDISARNLEAQERLLHPMGNYFERRPDNK